MSNAWRLRLTASTVRRIFLATSASGLVPSSMISRGVHLVGVTRTFSPSLCRGFTHAAIIGHSRCGNKPQLSVSLTSLSTLPHLLDGCTLAELQRESP